MCVEYSVWSLLRQAYVGLRHILLTGQWLPKTSSGASNLMSSLYHRNWRFQKSFFRSTWKDESWGKVWFSGVNGFLSFWELPRVWTVSLTNAKVLFFFSRRTKMPFERNLHNELDLMTDTHGWIGFLCKMKFFDEAEVFVLRWGMQLCEEAMPI